MMGLDLETVLWSALCASCLPVIMGGVKLFVIIFGRIESVRTEAHEALHKEAGILRAEAEERDRVRRQEHEISTRDLRAQIAGLATREDVSGQISGVRDDLRGIGIRIDAFLMKVIDRFEAHKEHES
jgi:hypothetical protein